MPAGVDDRDADVWEPLIAVADAAGGDWPQIARDTAVTLVTRSQEDTPSLGVNLLSDIRNVFGDVGAQPTESLLRWLNDMEEAPWGDLRGRELDGRRLAAMLKPYDIRPEVIRDGKRSFRGYRRADFEDAWQRYLPPLDE